MKTTKHVLLASHTQSLLPAAGLGKVDPLPSASAPTRPADYTPSKANRTRAQPSADLVKAAPTAAKEIAASTTYATDFGSGAPDAQALAMNLAFAAAWSGEYAKAEAWLVYVKEQTRLAWLQANPLLDELGGPFASARAARESTVDTRYASTAKLYDVRREPSVKGAAVRASKRAAKTVKTAKPKPETAVATPATNGVTHGVSEPAATPAVSASPTNGVNTKN